LPLTPIMILLINVIGVGVPGLFIAREQSDPNIMQRNPVKRGESLFNGLLLLISKQAMAFVIVGLIGYYIGTFVDVSGAHPPSQAIGQTITFLVVGWSAILHVFTVRSRRSIFKTSIVNNPMLALGAVVMVTSFALLVIAPYLADIFGMVAIGVNHWLIVAGLATIPTIVAEVNKFIRNRSETAEYKNRLVQHVSSTDE